MEKLVFNMYDYHVWANQTIFNHLKQLPQDVYTMEMQSVFPSVSKVMSHIYMVDHCWYDILSGKSMNEALASANQLIEQAEAKSIEELDALFSDLSERYKAVLAGRTTWTRRSSLTIHMQGSGKRAMPKLFCRS